MLNDFSVEAKVWLYNGEKASWHFATIPEDTSAEISMFHGHNKAGWGSLPVTVTIGETSWKTSIFPDSKTKTYLLPLKAEVRKKEKIAVGDVITIKLEIRG
jgi:hypothetical protein